MPREHQFPHDDCINCPHRKEGRVNKPLLKRLFDANFTHQEIADLMGVGRVTITNMVNKLGLKREQLSPDEFRRQMSSKMLDKMNQLLSEMDANKIDKASLSQLIVAFGTLFDKVRLHEGQSTENVAVGHIHKLDDRSLQAIREAIKASRDAKLEQARLEHKQDN